MPDITLSVTAAQAQRIREALRKPDGTLPTTAEIVAWIFRQLKAQVLRYETGQLSSQAEATKRAELEAEGW